MKIYSSKAIHLIKKFEGFSDFPYICPAGKKTIGYGYVLNQTDFLYKVSKKTADILLLGSLTPIVKCLHQKVKVELSQNQFDALCSLIYNWGVRGFSRSKGLKQLNNNNYTQAAFEFFDKDIGVVNVKGVPNSGLIRRRKAEYKLWTNK